VSDNITNLEHRKPPTKCDLHRYHYPRAIRLVWHHKQPKAMGGADTADNLIGVCDTGHYNTHQVLGSMVFGKARPKCTRSELRTATEGYDAWAVAGCPGNPQAAWGD
jgi:hypothetical protein